MNNNIKSDYNVSVCYFWQKCSGKQGRTSTSMKINMISRSFLVGTRLFKVFFAICFKVIFKSILQFKILNIRIANK